MNEADLMIQVVRSLYEVVNYNYSRPNGRAKHLNEVLFHRLTRTGVEESVARLVTIGAFNYFADYVSACMGYFEIDFDPTDYLDDNTVYLNRWKRFLEEAELCYGELTK